jgi:hypothetical protein
MRSPVGLRYTFYHGKMCLPIDSIHEVAEEETRQQEGNNSMNIDMSDRHDTNTR